jgi:hypothetical protein
MGFIPCTIIEEKEKYGLSSDQSSQRDHKKVSKPSSPWI